MLNFARSTTLFALLLLAATGVAVWTGCGPGGNSQHVDDSNDMPIVSERTGYDAGPTATTTKTAKPTVSPAEKILREMLTAYRKAKSYADAGELRRVDEAGNVLEQVTLSCAFQRPNKLRLHAYDATVVCDGKEFRAWTEGLSGQVLSFPCPEKLIEHYFLDENIGDPALVRSINRNPSPVQLSLLLSETAFGESFDPAATLTLLSPADVEGRKCQRVKVEIPAGLLVFWIDAKGSELRRLELKLPESQTDKSAPSIALIADFRGATLNGPIDATAFRSETSPQDTIVRRLVELPRPLPPSKLLEKKVGPFSFAGIGGKPATRESLAGKPAVVTFWSAEGGPSRDVLAQLQELRGKLGAANSVAFVCVNTDDPSKITDELVADTLKQWAIDLPMYRNDAGHAHRTFSIQFAPSMFLLDGKGTVQDSEVGASASLADDFGESLEKVLDGKSAAAGAKLRFEARERQYAQALRDASQAQAALVQEIPRAAVSPQSEPKNFTRKRLWKAADVKAPGNVLLVPGDDGPRIFVHDRWNSIVELGHDGRQVARHALNLPEKTPVTYFRTAVDAAGQRYFAAFASAQQQVFVFDDAWKQVLAYPPAGDIKHDGIADVQFVEVGDKLELAVAYWGELLGVQRVSLSGQRTWSDRTIQNVYRVASTAGPGESAGRLLCANSGHSLATFDLNAAGKKRDPVAVANRALTGVVAAQLDGQRRYVGLSEADGSIVTLGLDLEGNSDWHYTLPRGIHNEPVEFITTARLVSDEADHWLLAGPDGSIHLLDADGKLVDRFEIGAELTSLTGLCIGRQTVLLIGTTRGLEAWSLTRK